MFKDSENQSDKPPSNGHSANGNSELTVYLYNVVEDEWLFINALNNPGKKAQEIKSCNNTADCYYLSAVTNSRVVFVSPVSISDEFQRYAKKIMRFRQADVIVPEAKTNLLCEDLVSDKKAMGQLLDLAKNFKKLVLVSYSATPQFYKLRDYLTSQGLNVYIPEAPEIDSAWTVNFFGSKSGIRQLAQKSVAAEPDFMMPDGVICVGKYDAAKIAANKYLKQKGVVIKTNKGSSGNGLLIFRENELPNSYTACEKKIQEYLSQEDYWEKFPIIVEDLVNINYSAGGGVPSVEYRIYKNGRIEMLYFCSMLVTKKGKYYGMHMNDEILNERMVARFIDTGYYIAEQYSAAGYRGHFDIDMIVSKNGHIYISESNIRNTGGTDVYKIANKLIGKNFMSDSYVITEENDTVFNKKVYAFDELLELLHPLLYSPKTKEGVVINSQNSIKDKRLIYTVIGRSKKRAGQIQEEMLALL